MEGSTLLYRGFFASIGNGGGVVSRRRYQETTRLTKNEDFLEELVHGSSWSMTSKKKAMEDGGEIEEDTEGKGENGGGF